MYPRIKHFSRYKDIYGLEVQTTESFLAINSREIFEELLKETNREAISVISTPKHPESMHKYFKIFTIEELLIFFGIYILLENEYGNDKPTIEENFKIVKRRERFEMGYNRYSAIKECTKPDNSLFDRLVEEWVFQSKEHWIPGLEVTVSY